MGDLNPALCPRCLHYIDTPNHAIGCTWTTLLAAGERLQQARADFAAAKDRLAVARAEHKAAKDEWAMNRPPERRRWGKVPKEARNV